MVEMAEPERFQRYLLFLKIIAMRSYNSFTKTLKADLFLLDEPSAYLDVEQRLLISKIIKSMAQERDAAILVVDHDLMFLDYLSYRLIVFILLVLYLDMLSTHLYQ